MLLKDYFALLQFIEDTRFYLLSKIDSHVQALIFSLPLMDEK